MKYLQTIDEYQKTLESKYYESNEFYNIEILDFKLNENLITDKLTEYWNKLKSSLNSKDLNEIEKKDFKELEESINSMTDQEKIEAVNDTIKELETNKVNKFLIDFWNKFKSKLKGSVLNIVTLIILSSVFLQSCEVQKYYTSDRVNTRDAYYNKAGDKRPSTRYTPKKHKHYRIRWNKFQPGGGITYYW
jgi:hypothetical protein